MDYTSLVKDCLKKKPAAQQQLYDHFAPAMLGVCYRYTKSMEDAEDVLQEGFVKIYLHLGKFRSDGELGAWIRRIMVNTALNYLKKNKRYRKNWRLPKCPCTRFQTQPHFTIGHKQLSELIRNCRQASNNI
ncbi:MAG: RNA polymerase sigma factor [Ferruginibacter sp.]